MRNNIALSPWSDINRMWNLMDGFWPSRDMELVTASFPIDMYQENGRIIVRASTPGVRPEDLKVSLENSVLTITGETHQPFEDGKEGRTYHREHSYGKFMRSVRLPSDVNDEEIEANLEHGILTVEIPMKQPMTPQPRQIPVRINEAPKRTVEANAYADRPHNGKTQQPAKEREAVKT